MLENWARVQSKLGTAPDSLHSRTCSAEIWQCFTIETDSLLAPMESTHRHASNLMQLNREQLTEDIILSIASLVWVKSFELSEQDMKLRVSALERIARQILT